ncbi:MAG: hypothetical protein ACTHJ7_03650 [Candidatus Nitrosocosmicus sp.]
MGIIDVAIACSIDDSLEYCTYDNPEYEKNELVGYSLMFIQSKLSAMRKTNGFDRIEDLIERVISHETIHVAILKMEGKDISDRLDDFEISFPIGMGRIHIINMNYLGYASDNTGLITIN